MRDFIITKAEKITAENIEEVEKKYRPKTVLPNERYSIRSTDGLQEIVYHPDRVHDESDQYWLDYLKAKELRGKI